MDSTTFQPVQAPAAHAMDTTNGAPEGISAGEIRLNTAVELKN